VAAYLPRPNTTVIAAVRDPNHATSKSLWTLSKGASSTLIIVKIDSASKSSVAAAMEQLQSVHNVRALDVVIASAGISKCYPPVAEVTFEDVQEHFSINTIGPLLLFQAALPLMQSSKQPKFIAISSAAGSIDGMGVGSVPNAAYGPSKAALNYLTRKMHFEHKNLIAFPVDPG
jgi:norsolorinic acid ketoreductase